MGNVTIGVVNNAHFKGTYRKVKACEVKEEVCKEYFRLVHALDEKFDAKKSFLNYQKAYAEVSDGSTITTILVLQEVA